MCNEYVVEKVDGKWVWVVYGPGAKGRMSEDGGPEDLGELNDRTSGTNSWKPFPDRMGPVVRLDDQGALEILEMRWGFPPVKPGMPPVTNVRNLTSAYWRPFLKPEARCLVPVTKFCEWTDTPDPVTGKKSKRWFKLKADTPYMFAGIWRKWTGVRGPKSAQVDGEHLLYAFLTTEPNEIVGAVHSKAMPVILERKDWKTWLTAPWEIAKELVITFPDAGMDDPTTS